MVVFISKILHHAIAFEPFIGWHDPSVDSNRSSKFFDKSLRNKPDWTVVVSFSDSSSMW
jgi:hypothetical protein